MRTTTQAVHPETTLDSPEVVRPPQTAKELTKSDEKADNADGSVPWGYTEDDTERMKQQVMELLERMDHARNTYHTVLQPTPRTWNLTYTLCEADRSILNLTCMHTHLEQRMHLNLRHTCMWAGCGAVRKVHSGRQREAGLQESGLRRKLQGGHRLLPEWRPSHLPERST